MSKNNNYFCGLVCVIIIVGILYYCTQTNKEGFVSAENIENDILKQYMDESLDNLSDEEYKKKIANLRARLAKFGLYPSANSPDMSQYVLKNQLNPGDGKCIVASAEDRDKYTLKSAIPEPKCPGVDINKYVLKSSIQPEKICPPPKEIDQSRYVLKSTIPPAVKCPPCICPKVKVSAGLCKACPPPPKATCPDVKPCPNVSCPEPKPCPPQSNEKCHSVKYVKVPLVLKKSVKVNSRGEFVEEDSQDSQSSKDTEIKALLNSDGKPVIDSNGNPIYIDNNGNKINIQSNKNNNTNNNGPVASNDDVQDTSNSQSNNPITSELLNNKNSAFINKNNLSAYNSVGKPLSDAISSNLSDQNNASLSDNQTGASSLNEINSEDAINNGQIFNANTRETKQVGQPHFNNIMEKAPQTTIGGHVLANQPAGLNSKCGPVKFNNAFRRYGVYGTQYQN